MEKSDYERADSISLVFVIILQCNLCHREKASSKFQIEILNSKSVSNTSVKSIRGKLKKLKNNVENIKRNLKKSD